MLAVPQYVISLYKSAKHFPLSFAYDAKKIWNYLPDHMRSTNFLDSFIAKEYPS